MNVVVYPDDTAELDQRLAGQVCKSVFERHPIGFNLKRDERFVGRALCAMVGERNRLAMELVAHLNGGAYIQFDGPVVLADLTAEQAVELLGVAATF